MASSYKVATKRLQDDPAKPFNRRNYQLVLIEPSKASFNADHATLKATQEDDANPESDRAALRIQIIRDPTRPIGNSSLLQFFVQDPNRKSLIRTPTNALAGIIVEIDGAKEIPLFQLNSDEVWEMAHGNGYNTPILTAAVPAA